MKVGIVNAWGGNRGDEAMLSALCYRLLVKNVVETIDIYASDWLDLRRFNNVVVKPRLNSKDLFPNLPHSLAQAGAMLGLSSIGVLKRWGNKKLDYDFVVSSPAGPYLGDLYPETELSCLFQLAMMAAQDIPFGILATSAGPFNNPMRNFLRRQVIGHALFWTVRESISRRHLEPLALDIFLETGSDLVFAHAEREPEQFLNQHELGEFSRLVEDMKKRPHIIVVLNKTHYMHSDGTVVPFNLAEYSRKMGDLLRHIIDATDATLLINYHFYGSLDEQRIIEAVAACVDRPNHIRFLNPLLNAEAQMYLYRYAAFAISHRYHPTIFAAKALCPFLCIRHQFKVDGMLAMFDLSDPAVYSTDSVTKWIEGFDLIWASKEMFVEKLRYHLPEVKVASERHFQVLEQSFLS